MSLGVFGTAFGTLSNDAANTLNNIATAMESVEASILDVAEAFEGGAHSDKDKAKAQRTLDGLVAHFRNLSDAKKRAEFGASVVREMKANLLNEKNPDGSVRAKDLDSTDALLARFANKDDLLENIPSFERHYQTTVKAKTKAYEKLSDEQKYNAKSSKEYAELMKKLAEICTTGPYSGSQEEEDSDADLAIVGGQTNYKCPLTQTLMTAEIFTSTTCHHSFSDAIHHHIRASVRGSAECPVAGCNKYVTESCLKRDKGMERKVKMHIRQTQEEEEARATQNPANVIE
ncbi:hypothetical protein HDU98_000655 [Podochytrium sp. JEL0797]|nr:hypothetical protein HDU98_000655 [Podochytrium sp. JEL0797]